MFQSGSPVKGENFIDRKKHLPVFKSYLDNNQHIMIKAPRRFGKTSLIEEDLTKIKEEAVMQIEQTLRYNNSFLKTPQILGSIWLRITSNPKMQRINRNNIKPNNPCDIIEEKIHKSNQDLLSVSSLLFVSHYVINNKILK